MALYKSTNQKRIHYLDDYPVKFENYTCIIEDESIAEKLDEAIKRHKAMGKPLGIERVDIPKEEPVTEVIDEKPKKSKKEIEK